LFRSKRPKTRVTTSLFVGKRISKKSAARKPSFRAAVAGAGGKRNAPDQVIAGTTKLKSTRPALVVLGQRMVTALTRV